MGTSYTGGMSGDAMMATMSNCTSGSTVTSESHHVLTPPHAWG